MAARDASSRRLFIASVGEVVRDVPGFAAIAWPTECSSFRFLQEAGLDARRASGKKKGGGTPKAPSPGFSTMC